MRPTFLYYLFSSNKKPLYVNNDGVVSEGDELTYTKEDGQPAHLDYSPDGWKDTLVKFGRNIKYWGIFRDFTSPMKFYNDGAKILRERMWNFGIEAVCYLGIAKLDRLSLPYNYKSWYLSEVNFVKYKESIDNVTVEALEGGLSKYIKAFENTVYEIPIGEDAVRVLMDGFNFSQASDFLVSNGIVNENNGQHLIDITLLNEETINSLGSASVARRRFNNNADLYNSQDYFLKTGSSASTITLDFKFDVNITLATGITPNPVARSWWMVRVFDESNTQVFFDLIKQVGGNSDLYNITHNVEGSYTFTAPANCRCYAVCYLALGDYYSGGTIISGEAQDGAVYWNYQSSVESYFNVRYTYRHPSTWTFGYYFYDLAKKLVEKMTDGKYTLKSDWLSNKKDIVITSGQALRQIEGMVIKTSLSDLYKSLGHWSPGLGIENDTLVIEPIKYFFKDDVFIKLGEVSKAEISVAEDLMFNTFKIGYNIQEYGDVNGSYEFNQGQAWTTPLTRITKEYDFVSTYRADALGIEYIRVNLEGKNTTDADSDNDCFMLHVESNKTILGPLEYHKLYRPEAVITGIPDAVNIFNHLLTPKRAILNNGDLIRSLLDKQDGNMLRLASADKNTNLSVTINGSTVIENEQMQISGLGQKLFLPYYITINCEVPYNYFDLMKSSLYSKVEFTWRGKNWYGYLFDGGIKQATNETQTWKLLFSPENDLSKFNK